MTNHILQETQSPFGYVDRNNVIAGDTIEVVTNNQLGYKKYKVVIENGNKLLVTIADWGAELYED
jgi:hypothetical protein